MDYINQEKQEGKDPFAEQKIEKTRNSIFGFFITRIRLVFLLIITILALGSLAINNIPRESDPEVKIPISLVTTVYQGASPADVEDLVTNKIESEIEELDDVKLVTSSSVLGISTVVVEFEADANLDDTNRDLRDKIAEVRGLPDEANDPTVTQVRANDQPIITFSFAGNLSDQRFKELGELIQDELESIPGVSEALLIGVRDREFAVTVSRARLDQLNVSLNQIVSAIATSNSDTPLGSISIDSVNYNIRTVAKIDSLEKLKKVVVTTIGSRPILLQDVANIEDRLVETDSLSRLSIGGNKAINTISIQILKKTGGNILDIVDTAKQTLDDMKSDERIPASVGVEVSSDFSQFIRNDLNTLGRSGIFAVVLIFIVMLLALSFKEALISLFAIPLTFLITIYILFLRGDTLNSLSLFALVLSLGLLVDTFIIILEGIFHNMRIGYSAQRAALLAVAHYRNPLLAGTFTTISAFIPMLLVSGILGEYLRVLPITIATVLLSSLFISLIIVPALASVFLKRKKIGEIPKESPMEKYLTNRLVRYYRKTVHPLMVSKKKKWKFLIMTFVLFIGSMALLITGRIPVEMFPKVDINFTFIDVEMPIGTNLEVTNEVVQEVEKYLYARNEVKSFVSTVGLASSGFDFGSSASSNEHLANVNVNFVDLKDRDKKSYEINDELRRDLEKIIRRGKITVRELTSGPPTGAPIEVRITGDNLIVLDQLTDRLLKILEKTEGVIEIESSRDVSPADLTFTINREALASAGLSVPEVSGFLRTAIFGLTATEISVGGQDVDVVVKLDDDKINSVEQIQNLTILNNQGQSIKLSRVADFSFEPALATIRHRDFERTATVQASLETGFVASAVVPAIEKEILATDIPDGYEFNFGGEVEDIEQSFSELWSAMIVAVLLIVLILVLQFDSFKKPLAILFALPFSLIGVVIGMLVFHLPFSFSVFLGLISLVGIVVNDSIVLLDKAKRNVEESAMSPSDAVINAGETRLQPILLTSITTIIGIVPLAFADEFWLGLSVSIAFGLAFATILQLYLIPMFYLKLEGKNALKRRGKKVA